MARRSFAVRDIAEIIEHWYAGRCLQAVANSLGVDRKTVRKYAAIARAAGFQPGEGQAPTEGWGVWLETVEITDVLILSKSLFEDLQAAFRQQTRLEAERIRLNTERAIEERGGD